MATIKEETLHQFQKRTKPLVEDAINQRLDGDMKKNALNLVAFAKENKLNFTWGGTINTWKATCKGKPICFIRIDTNYDEKQAWSAAVRLHHFREYENFILGEGLQDEIFKNLSHCDCRPNKCGNAKVDTVFGKEITRCCYTLGFGSKEPNETTVERIKWILELEVNARRSLYGSHCNFNKNML